MVSITQLKEVMETANLSVEGREKLNALVKGTTTAHGFAILPEGHPVVDIWKNGSGSMRFAIQSAQDVRALDELRQYDTGTVLYSGSDGAPVVPMYIVWNDAVDKNMPTLLGIIEKAYGVGFITLFSNDACIADFPPYLGAIEKVSAALGFEVKETDNLVDIAARMGVAV